MFSDEEERGALRLFLRALRRLPTDLDWRATIWLRDPASTPAPTLSRRMRERVTLAGPADGSEAQHLARATIAVAASAGTAPAPQLVLRAMAGGAVPVVSRLPQYEELLREGELGPLFEPRDALTLAAQLERLLRDPKLLSGYAERDPGRPPRHRAGRAWPTSSRSSTSASPRAGTTRTAAERSARSSASENFVHVDLHMHTDHSPDCATPVDTLLDTAKRVGLGAIAITDHNEISGALEARERANGIKVIVAEEVKTADQGEVIGLFIEEKIPRGMTLQETIAEIRRQGGLVYVPHPFDRMHAVPDYEHLLDVVEEIDAIEVFNPRVAFSAFNEEAARFAAKYRIVAGAGSDSHVAQGLGSVKIRMRDFDGSAGVPRVAARRRHRPKAPVAPLRSGAEVHPDARQEVMRPKGAQRSPSKPSDQVPATDDEIREKYLERAIRELNLLTREIQELRSLPARQPHARARLGPPAGGHLAAQVRAGALGDRGGRGVLRARRQRADEELQAPRHRPARRLRDRVREVPCARHGRLGARLPRARARGDHDRAAADRGRDGRGGDSRS